MSFKPGDKVRINSPESGFHDQTCHVTSQRTDIHATTEGGITVIFSEKELELLPDPGEGYRLMDIKEDVIQGDEYFYKGQWYESWNWKEGYTKVEGSQSTGIVYRRRISPPEPWVKTVDLQWKVVPDKTRSAWFLYNGDRACAVCVQLQQRWTRGTEEEWRPLEIVP